MEGPQRYMDLSKDVTYTLDKVGHFLGRLVDGGTFDGGHRPLIDKELGSYFTRFFQLKERNDGNALSCAVLALTKSGKSTLLNALLGASCLPSSNVPETARITRIIHAPLKKGEQPKLVYQVPGDQGSSTSPAPPETKTFVGEYSIREHLRYLNREVRTRDHNASDEAFLDVHIPVAALETFHLDPEGVSLHLLDTPGPNEYGEESLKHRVERILDSVDAVLYLLDYSKLKTAEEATLLGKLKDINPQLIARLSQRLFFVVNKIDLTRTSEGLDPDEIKEYVANLVTSQLATEGFQLSPDQVLLLSAQDAMLSRLILKGKASKEERLRFGKLAFGSRNAISTPDDEYTQAAEEMLRESGLEELEQRVLGFLCTNSGTLKLLSTIDDAQRLLHQVHNVAAASNAALQQDVKTLQEDTEKLQDELTDVLEQFDGVQQEADQVKGEVVDEVSKRMQHLKEDLFEKVSAVLKSPNDRPNGQAALRAALAGRWQAALDKAARFWARHRDSSNAARAEMEAPLQELHEYIHATIDAEVRGFWAQLEAATNERQQAMFRVLNVHLKHLAQRVEAAVGEILEVHLEPATLKLEPPTAQQFHTDLQTLFSTAISPRKVERTRKGKEEYVVWEKRRRRTGLCRYSDYYVGRPAQRTTEQRYSETVFELRPEQVTEYFMKLVDETVSASLRHVRSFVHQYLSARLAEARAQIEQYGSRYTEAMLHALDTSKQGEAARLASLAAVQQHLAAVGRLLEDTTALQRCAAQLLPAGEHLPEEEQLLHAGSEAGDHEAHAEGEAIEVVNEDGSVNHMEAVGGGEGTAAGGAARKDTDFEDAFEDLTASGMSLPVDVPVLDLNPEYTAPAVQSAPLREAPAASSAGPAAATVPCKVAWGRVVPAMRNRRGSGRAAADTNALLGAEEGKSTNTLEATALPHPVIDMPTAEEAPSAGGAFLASLQNTIWTSKDDVAPEAGKAAIASIDRMENPQSAAVAALERANNFSGAVDMNKWSAMEGFTDSDEEGNILCSCGKVHPPTYHQPYRSSAVREENAAAAAAAAAAFPAATKAAPSADSLAEPADAGNEKAVQDAAHLTAPAAPVEALPPSTHGPSAPLSEETFEMWPQSAGEASAEHVIQPDSPATLPAEHVKSEDGAEAGKEIRSQDSDDWTMVETASDAGAGADAEPEHQASKA